MKGKTLARVLVRSTSVLGLTAGLLLASQGQAQTAPIDPPSQRVGRQAVVGELRRTAIA